MVNPGGRKFNNGQRRRRFVRRPFRGSVLSIRDITSKRINLNRVVDIPQWIPSPNITRIIRVVGQLDSGSLTKINITALMVAQADALAYGTPAPAVRYRSVMFQWCKAYGALSTGTAATGSNMSLILEDAAGYQVSDTPTEGVRRAIVGIKNNLEERQFIHPTSSVSIRFQLQAAGIPASVAMTVTIDVGVIFCGNNGTPTFANQVDITKPKKNMDDFDDDNISSISQDTLLLSKIKQLVS